MRELRPEDYEKLAQRVVHAFLTDDTPLSDGVTKVAMELELNPHQIRNLTQLSNVTAHLKLFEKKADDKIVEFLPVDPKDVIQKMFKEAAHEKTAAADDYDQAVDLYGDFDIEVADTPMEKLAEDYVDPKPMRHPEHQSRMILRLRKVASELNSRRIQNAQDYVERLDKLASEFAKLYGPDFHSFEKDAVAQYGDVAVPALNDIRSRLRMGHVNLDIAGEMHKVARVVDDGTPEMQGFKQLLKFAAGTSDCARGLAYLEEQAGGVL